MDTALFEIVNVDHDIEEGLLELTLVNTTGEYACRRFNVPFVKSALFDPKRTCPLLDKCDKGVKLNVVAGFTATAIAESICDTCYISECRNNQMPCSSMRKGVSLQAVYTADRAV